ncbi:ferrochelatase, partial [Campylobacter jejuni]|nr:ferrochelatase [Campylobacter jejuni]
MKLVLFLNMGGATNLQDCEVFKNMFNDPYILGIKIDFKKFVAWIITKARVKAMQE